ncbi:glycosyl transferase family 2 [Curtobacterium sp. PhB130]|uniref:glycosyltransferase n=1 Tax=Curtobacterium sp. PhB130 TaxID=2485178 RepID=UPI000F4B87CF|nr:glycosyltransferase [Curtobacterium sp. PhB130]ROS72038.1 glycosyl transferase family 2 [Curtobacterium sp. PhB130]
MTRATLAMVVSPIVTGPLFPTWDGALWVGEVDRADVHASSHRDVIALEGAEGYRRARLLVRDHGEPLGFVEADVTERRRIGATIDVRTLQRAIRPMPAPTVRPAADQVLPSVTVVLCTDGAADQTMRSVLAVAYDDFDVVVVSRGARAAAGADTDTAAGEAPAADVADVADVVIEGRRVRTIPAPAGGLAAARNAGLLAATGDVVAFVDEGAVVDAGWLRAIGTAFAADADVACVTGLVPSVELRTPAQRWRDDRTPAARTVRRRVIRLDDDRDDLPMHPFAASAYGTGANLAVHRATALRIGGFDTAFGPGTRVGAGDDLDLFTRLLFAGAAIAVEPAAIAWQRTADDVASLRAAAAAHGHGLGAWMTKNAFDRETFTASVDVAPEALSAFARLGLEQGDHATHVDGEHDARPLDAVDEAFVATKRRLRGVERRSALTAPFLAARERLGGAGTIDRTAHGRHELQRGLETAGAARPVASDAMGPAARLVAAGIVVMSLVLAAVGSVLGLPALRGSAIGVFLFALLGVAPLLLVRPMPLARFAVLAVTGSLAGTIAIGYTMATFHLWVPAVPFVGVVVLTAAAVAIAVPRDVADLRRAGLVRRDRPVRARWSTTATVTAGSLLGLVVVVVAALTHIGDPVPAGLFGSLGPGLVIGLAIVVAAAVVALVRGRGLAVPVVVLGGVIQLAQAITYGVPTVMAAARHIGVLEYIRQNGGTNPSSDIFQTWSGLFAGGAWVADVGGIVNAMTIAAWVPVLLAFSTTIAVGVLASHWLPGNRRPWIAAFLTAATGSLNTTYFSPQSTGILMSIVILVLATGPLRKAVTTAGNTADTNGAAAKPRARKVGLSRIIAITAIGIVLVVTHQISPYLTVAALVALIVFRLVRPWWLPVVVLVPAIVFAALNGDVLGRFLSLAAVGKVLDNVQPPTHDLTVLPKPLVTRLAFDIPAAALVVLGLLALITVLLRRDRVHWGLLAAAASPISLLVATNYGQEGIFRVVLFATPWIAILAAAAPMPAGRLAWVGGLVGRVMRPTAVKYTVAAAGIAALVAIGAFGQTSLDWNRVMTRSQSEATQLYDATAPKGSVLLLTGSGNAVPSNTGARYFDVGYLSREALGAYPDPTGTYDATTDVGDITSELVNNWTATKYYALVAEPFGAYDERYGYQSDADYQQLAKAMASSPYWHVVWSSGTTAMYELTAAGLRHASS